MIRPVQTVVIVCFSVEHIARHEKIVQLDAVKIAYCLHLSTPTGPSA